MTDSHLSPSMEPIMARPHRENQGPHDVRASREQLPSLSSILGASRTSLPTSASLSTSFSDRSPSYSYASTTDTRRTSPPTYSERASWDPIYQRPPPPPAHYPYDSRPSKTHKPDLPSLNSRPSLPGRLPMSPQFQEPRYSPKDQERPTFSSGRYSPRTDPPFREFFPPVKDGSSHRPPLDSHNSLPPPAAFGRDSESRSGYPLTTPSTPTYPLTPTSTIVSEPVTTKDGLGPKIWTGTQFLPRFVRQAEVSGEGLCYFYDDGTHCKTNIDGEAVNAHWGVTKAGKPRKRLAIACITCREKKIKCDPDYPRCIQCEKFGRICKFKNAPRGGQNSPESSPADLDDGSQPRSQRSIDPYRMERKESRQSISPRMLHEHTSPESDSALSKRRKLGYNEFTPIKHEREVSHYKPASPPVEKRWFPYADRTAQEASAIRWPQNPYNIDEPLVLELVQTFFSHISSTTCNILPEKQFQKWLTNREIAKTEDDIVLIYAVMAAATIFSIRKGSPEIVQEFSKASKFASSRNFCLQIAQSRLLFSLYFDSIGEYDRSWDSLGAAMRAAIGCKLHLELPSDGGIEAPYGLSQIGHAEVRRRTFWSCYVLDRLQSLRDDRVSSVCLDDVYLRMPCDNRSFENETLVENPYFDAPLTMSENPTGTFGCMAYLVVICSTYGQVAAETRRSTMGSKSRLPVNFHDTMTENLQAWHNSVPPCITYNMENICKTTEFGVLGTFAAMHVVYHCTQILLNGVIIYPDISNIETEYRQRKANRHADRLLREIGNLSSSRNQNVGVNLKASGLSPPFLGSAISLAFNELVKEGKIGRRGVAEKFASAIEVLDELAAVWPSAAREKYIALGNV